MRAPSHKSVQIGKFVNACHLGGPDVGLLKVQPVYLLPLKRRWWMQVDTESTTFLNISGYTGFTSGFRVGKLISRHLAMWIEPRVGWGRYRESDFVFRSSLYWIR